MAFCLQDIGMFLYEVSSKDSQLWVCAEALDAMFDTFSDDGTDSILRDIDLVTKLKALVPGLKTKVSKLCG